MKQTFDIDPYPKSPKILFIGLGISTHTHSWIDLLSGSRLNVRLFSVPGGGLPPSEWEIPTYVCELTSLLPFGLDTGNRKSLYPLPEELKSFDEEIRLFEDEIQKRKAALEKNTVFKLSNFLRNKVNFGMRFGMPYLDYNYSVYSDLSMPIRQGCNTESPEEWLAKIIQSWRPDIIHTLGLFDSQGGIFYYAVRQQFRLKGIGKWVLQLRGGSDLALRRYNPETARHIFKVLSDCDEIITDNFANITYIKQLGLAHKVASIAPVPGTGGVDTAPDFESIVLPSRRERIILWPKAYESIWSKALPVLEGIKIAWEAIKPCKIYMTASIPETEAWFLSMLPQEIRESCILVERVPRDQMLALMKQARVLLIPSLVDGVPNSLYEAMANGVFPILSPLETITPVVKSDTNVLFARNLYPIEISEALIRAVSDDALVDQAAKNNLELVKRIASREKTAKQVIEYYQYLSSESKQ